PKPILLTQMALVHADDVLPDSRVKLYQVCVELLLWKWERLRALQGGRQGKEADKFIGELGIPGLQRKTLEDALFDAVFAAHAEGEVEIPESILLARLRDALTAYGLSKERAVGPAQRFIDEWLRERNGLLIPAQADTFDFPHRSFREFIAGGVLMRSGYQPAPGEAAARPQRWTQAAPRLTRADPTKWREVFRFAAAQSGVLADVCDALEGLLAADERVVLVDEDAQLLAAEVVRDLKPDQFLNPANRWARSTYDRIERNLIHLMRDTAGGDYPDDPPHDPSTAAHTAFPETRLEAGLLLDSLGWTPPDLWHFILIDSPPLRSGGGAGGGGFAIAKYPLTVLQYQRFLESPDYADPDIWQSIVGFDAEGNRQTDLGEEAWQWLTKSGGPNRRPYVWDDPRFGPPRRLFPVVGVTWHEAAAYCAWLNRHWQEDEAARAAIGGMFGGQFQLRLPREAEWVAVAGGEDEKRYPWGEGGEVRYHANTAESNLKRTTPVCMYPLGASPLGVIDMGGNVWEWQANLYERGQPYRAIRGGSWHNDETLARVAARDRSRPGGDWIDIGFRVGAFPG
ncbi:MAG TPA: SUMF1/EgtB/PvdO family nonheme iron enzyme, partial [Anaerolineales bacterium]|nr:SUMF1/EgtB/PvdO family nonheme iron enzyme [Anaerolineales bacterium]